MKRTLWFLIALLVLLCGVAAAEATIIAGGDGGAFSTNINWELNSEGTMTISGTGAMQDYASTSNVPWGSYLSSIETVVIHDGVTSIGSFAFSGCSGLTSVSIPGSVSSIGNSAFSGCSNITSVSIDSTDAWLNISFSGDSSNPLYYGNATLLISGNPITDITIPDGVTHIGNHAFRGCSSLSSISIPGSVSSIGNFAFHGCSNITSVSIDSIEAWLDISFSTSSSNPMYYGNATLLISGNPATDITIPDGVTSINSYAFYRYSGLNSVSIPGSVSSIGSYAFSDCSGLNSVSIPGGVSSIGSYAFRGCFGLTGISIPGSVSSIGNFAFYGCSALSNVSIAEGVSSIGSSAFESCSSLSSISIPGSVSSIGYSAFESCSSLSSISIPEGVSSIGESTFYGCSNLKNISIPASASSIGGHAFDDCALERILIFEDSLSSFNYGGINPARTTFYCHRESGLAAWAEENGFALVYIEQMDLTCPLTIALPQSYSRLAVGQTFTVSAELFPASAQADKLQWTSSAPEVVSVEGGILTALTTGEATITAACGDVSAQMDVTAYVQLESFELSAAELWIVDQETAQLSIASIQPENAEASFGWSVSDGTIVDFDANTGCVTAKAPGEATIIATSDEGLERSCLVHVCYPATAVEFDPAQLTVAENNAAQLQASVTTRDGSSYVNRLVTFASSDESVATVNAEGVVTAHTVGSATITATASSGVSAECAVSVRPAIVASGDCSASGSSVAWDLDREGTLTIAGTGEMKAYKNKANIPWNSYLSSIKTVVIQEGVTYISTYAFYDCFSLNSVTIGEDVSSIGGYAFYGCSNLSSISLPGSVSSIGYSAFDDCSNLKSISISEGVASIGDSAFSGCSSLSSISLPGSVSSIGYSAFFGCSSLNSVSIPGSVSFISNYAFCDCSALKSVSIAEGVSSIGASAFRCCFSLNSVSIPRSVSFISNEAFYGCSALKSISIPGSVSSIGKSAFHGCSTLKSVSIPGSVSSIDSYAFYNCSNLTSISLPEGLTSIGESAFECCSRLTGVSIPEGVSSIDSYAFNGCSSLNSVSIPEGISSIGTSAFSGCNLQRILVLDDSLSSFNYGGISTSCTTFYCHEFSAIDFWATENGYSYVYIDDMDLTQPISISLPQSYPRLAVGQTATISASLFPACAQGDIQWTSSAPEVVSVEDGVLTALSVGEATITAACGELSAQMDVTTYAHLKSFELSASELWIVSKDTAQLSIASIQPENAEVRFSWSSSDSTIANIDASTGLITARTPGEATVTVTSDNGIERSCLVHVCYPVTAIELTPAQLVLAENGAAQLQANVTTRDGSSYVNRLVTFASSDEGVASVTADGTVTALRPGSATITATASSGISAECSVSVRAVQELNLPAFLQSIEEEAFAGTAAETVILPEGCTSIGARAFADSAALTFVYMPDSVTDIADNAFAGSDNVTFRCASDNAAAAYARSHDIPCTIG